MRLGQHQKNSLKLPSRGRAEKNEEWGRESEGISICLECKNIRFKKQWHHPGIFPFNFSKVFKTREKICPACKMIRDHAFEGEVFIENLPPHRRQEVFNLISAFGERALRKDPQDRIITAEPRGDRAYYVTVTENQLAVKLAKKIKDAFKNVIIKISYAREPAEVSRVYVVFRKAAS
jgi:hypothetical protein